MVARILKPRMQGKPVMTSGSTVMRFSSCFTLLLYHEPTGSQTQFGRPTNGKEVANKLANPLCAQNPKWIDAAMAARGAGNDGFSVEISTDEPVAKNRPSGSNRRAKRRLQRRMVVLAQKCRERDKDVGRFGH